MLAWLGLDSMPARSREGADQNNAAVRESERTCSSIGRRELEHRSCRGYLQLPLLLLILHLLLLFIFILLHLLLLLLFLLLLFLLLLFFFFLLFLLLLFLVLYFILFLLLLLLLIPHFHYQCFF